MRLNRKEHIQPSALAQSQQRVDNFVHRIFLHFLTTEQAVGASHASKEQPQVVKDLSSRGNSGPRIPRGVLLLDGHRRRNPVDQIDVRLLNPLQKLARIRRQRFHVAPLPLGVNRIEGKRRLPRPGDASDDGQSVVFNLKIDVLEVMNPGPANNNAICGHLPLALQTDQNPQPNLSIIKRR